MLLVIEAVEEYGRDSAFRILRDAERLAQTKATVEWLSNELRRDYDIKDLGQDNYRFAVAVALCHAQVDQVHTFEDKVPVIAVGYQEKARTAITAR